MMPSEFGSIRNALGTVIEIKVNSVAGRNQPEAAAREAATTATEIWLDQRGHDSRSALFQDLVSSITREIVDRNYRRAWAERSTRGYRF